jgi:hypothetical protein
LSTNPEIELAVLKSQVEGLREQHKEQFNLLRNDAQGTKSDLRDVKDELKNIAEHLNKGRGALSAIILASSIIGGLTALLGKLIVYGRPPI